MAAQARPHLALLPEERVANRVVERYGLRHPFDVLAFAREVADVVLAVVPVDIDAVTVKDPPGGGRARIVLNRRKPATRRVFTVAHELGHVFIPWHVGRFADANLEDDREGARANDRAEAEANRFAAELLAPRRWVEELLARDPDPAAALEEVGQMGMSGYAAGRTLAERLPPDHLVVGLSGGGRVSYAFGSPGTLAPRPARGSRFDPDPYRRAGGECFLGEGERPAFAVVRLGEPGFDGEPEEAALE